MISAPRDLIIYVVLYIEEYAHPTLKKTVIGGGL